jgi:glycosyltransferase involved in cell wall biosynthesis
VRSFILEDHIRACLVSFQFWPRVGGAEVQAQKQARQLQAFGHDVIVVTLRHDRKWKPKETVDGLPVVRVGGIYKRGGALRLGRFGHLPIDIGMFFSLWRLRHRYDVIHVFQISPVAAVAAFVGKLAHKPVIISIQSTGPNDTQRAQIAQGPTLMADTLDNLADLNFLKVDFIDIVSASGDLSYLPQTALGGHAILNFLRKSDVYYQVLSNRGYPYLASRGFRADQIVHISNGIDTTKFHLAPELRPDPTRPERDVICVARMDYAKGVDVLVHAWGRMMQVSAQLREDLKPRLRLVGDGILMRHIERIVVELGIQNSVEFLGLRTDIADLLQRAWAFVLPSRWEGMPNALLEAMACGLPCVATRVSGSEDLISDGVNGLLVEPEQPAEMALALYRVMEDPDLAQRLGQEALATVIREYQLTLVVEQCLGLYHRLLTKGNKALPLDLERKELGR